MLCKRSRSKSSILSRVVLTVGIATLPLAVAAESDGWYTKAQAEEGQVLYNTYCAQCHRTDLSGAMGPPLKGEGFLSRYKTGAKLYSYAYKSMPPTNPGSVPEGHFNKIMAFILSENGLPAGAPLTPENLDRPLKP
jgi:S-disulfanyl-L-cysteine oxidoreductase SoxD